MNRTETPEELPESIRVGIKTPDEFPDHGLQYEGAPEVLASRRDAVFSCVRTLVLAPVGYKQFESAIIEMFHQFQVEESSETSDQQINRRKWRHIYEVVQALKEEIKQSGQPAIDIEIRGKDKSYANIDMTTSVNANGDLAVSVFPGACSSLHPKRKSNPYFPERNFYDVFEKTIGSDPSGENLASGEVFVVTEDDYKKEAIEL